MNYAEISKHTISSLYKAYNSLNESPIDKNLKVLLEIRTSQINGCSYCCEMYFKDARKNNISQQKLDLLPVWYSTNGIFSEKEMVALKWCEAVTYCDPEELSGLREDLDNYFSEKEIVDITSCISIMNALNRIAISLRE